jgi:hypothetical protein
MVSLQRFYSTKRFFIKKKHFQSNKLIENPLTQTASIQLNDPECTLICVQLSLYFSVNEPCLALHYLPLTNKNCILFKNLYKINFIPHFPSQHVKFSSVQTTVAEGSPPFCTSYSVTLPLKHSVHVFANSDVYVVRF